MEREYLFCLITRRNGQTYENPLRLSEAHLIPQMLRENKSVHIERRTIDKRSYGMMFNLIYSL